MIFLKFTYIDAKTKIPATQSTMPNGPKMPEVDGLEFSFAEESNYPTNAPVMYGTCPDASDISKQGVLEVLTESNYSTAMGSELNARKSRDRKRVNKIRDRYLFTNATYTFPGDGEPDAIQFRDERDRQNIQDNMIDAQGKDPGATMYFMPLSNNLKTITAQQMLDMGAFLKSRGDAIYNHSWTKKNIEIEGAATLEELRAVDLNEGWPE